MFQKILIASILIAQLTQFVINVEIARLTTTVERQAEELESEEDEIENVTNIDESMKKLHQSTTEGEAELIMVSEKDGESGIKKS